MQLDLNSLIQSEYSQPLNLRWNLSILIGSFKPCDHFQVTGILEILKCSANRG